MLLSPYSSELRDLKGGIMLSLSSQTISETTTTICQTLKKIREEIRIMGLKAIARLILEE